MAVTNKELIPAKYAEDSQTTQYTSTNCTTIIDKFTATNTDASAIIVFSVNLVPPSGSAGGSNRILDGRQIAPGETYTCPELVGQTIDKDGIISTLASAASLLTIRCSGRQVTT